METNTLELIRNGETQSAFKLLYRSFPQVKSYIRKNSGNRMDAEDIFQQALYVFHEKITNPSFKLTTTPEGYVFSVARILWKERLRKQSRSAEIEDSEDLNNEDVASVLEKESKLQKIEEALSQIGEKCLQILKLFYYQSKSMEEIAAEMKYSSENAIKTRKYKCLEKVRELVRS